MDRVLVREPDSSPELEVLRADHRIDLEPGEVGAIVEAIVRDKDGHVTDYKRWKSKSFVQAALQLLYVQVATIFTPNTLSITDTGNVARNVYFNHFLWLMAGAIGTITDGIVVGTDATAPAVTDYALYAIIAHGVGAGQLQYSAQTWGAPSNDASVSQFRVTRNFANGSGGSITVNECGLYVLGFDGSTKYFCIVRDTTGGIAIPNGQTLTLNYQIQTTV